MCFVLRERLLRGTLLLQQRACKHQCKLQMLCSDVQWSCLVLRSNKHGHGSEGDALDLLYALA